LRKPAPRRPEILDTDATGRTLGRGPVRDKVQYTRNALANPRPNRQEERRVLGANTAARLEQARRRLQTQLAQRAAPRLEAARPGQVAAQRMSRDEQLRMAVERSTFYKNLAAAQAKRNPLRDELEMAIGPETTAFLHGEEVDYAPLAVETALWFGARPIRTGAALLRGGKALLRGAPSLTADEHRLVQLALRNKLAGRALTRSQREMLKGLERGRGGEAAAAAREGFLKPPSLRRKLLGSPRERRGALLEQLRQDRLRFVLDGLYLQAAGQVRANLRDAEQSEIG
jgi:hypothetical protein